MLVDGQKSTDKRGLSELFPFRYKNSDSQVRINHILKRMSIFYSKCKNNEIGLHKESKDQKSSNCQSESLPNEIMVSIFSYLDKNELMKVSMVNKRWFQVANYEIDNLLIKWPKQQNQDFQNLINRFPRLKNIELATKIQDSDILSFFDSFEFDGTLEFDIDPDLIPTKNWEVWPSHISQYVEVDLNKKSCSGPKTTTA